MCSFLESKISAHTVLELQKAWTAGKEAKKEDKERKGMVYGRSDVNRCRNGVFTEDNGSMG